MAASSQVLINSPAPRPAEECLPSAWLPVQDSWIADSVSFRAAKRPNPARKTFGGVSPDLSFEGRRGHHAWASRYLEQRSDQLAAMALNVLSRPCPRTHKRKRCSCDETIATGLHRATIHLPQVCFMPSALFAWCRNSAFPEAAEP